MGVGAGLYMHDSKYKLTVPTRDLDLDLDTWVKVHLSRQGHQPQGTPSQQILDPARSIHPRCT